MNKLSMRLEMVASLVPNGVNCADIGADHGYLIISLLNRLSIFPIVNSYTKIATQNKSRDLGYLYYICKTS